MDQIDLFPLADLKTEGYAKPEPNDDETSTETAEADAGAEAA